VENKNSVGIRRQKIFEHKQYNSTVMELFAALILGFFGSFHCIGMCGPLVLALGGNSRFLLGRVLHNTGRLITYGVFGLIFGLIGSRLNVAGLQQTVSISMGVIIAAYVILPHRSKTRFIEGTGLNNSFLLLKRGLSRLYKSQSALSKLAVGVLNGFLPCGFVYIALTGALIAGSAEGSALFMIMFGLGTVPAMLAVSIAGKIVTLNFRDRIRRLVPAFSLLIALIFILRGLNLGIPYLSPSLEIKNNQSQNIICH
jgi:sulfite exporter TauE/SafE